MFCRRSIFKLNACAFSLGQEKHPTGHFQLPVRMHWRYACFEWKHALVRTGTWSITYFYYNVKGDVSLSFVGGSISASTPTSKPRTAAIFRKIWFNNLDNFSAKTALKSYLHVNVVSTENWSALQVRSKCTWSVLEGLVLTHLLT